MTGTRDLKSIFLAIDQLENSEERLRDSLVLATVDTSKCFQRADFGANTQPWNMVWFEVCKESGPFPMSPFPTFEDQKELHVSGQN